jgi:hypothetical protein
MSPAAYAWMTTMGENEPWLPTRFHAEINRELLKIADGRTKRLIVEMAPQHGKSSLVSEHFTAWYLGTFPTHKVQLASYSSSLSHEWSLRARERFREWGPLVHGVHLSAMKSAMGDWKTSEGGGVFAAGVDGSFTGRGSNCVTGETQVLTRNGLKAVKDIEMSASPCYVLSYDRDRDACTFQRIRGVLQRNTQTIWRLRTASGNVVECTGDHRIYTQRGWREAASIVVGDVFLSSLRTTGVTDSGGDGEKSTSWSNKTVLQYSLRGLETGLQIKVSSLQCFNEWAKSQIYMLRNVSPDHTKEGWHKQKPTSKETASTATLRDMSKSIYSQGPRWTGLLLQRYMRESSTCSKNEGKRESKLSTWTWKQLWRPKKMVCGKTSNMGTRRDDVRSLQVNESYRRSSYRHDSNTSRAFQSCLSLQKVPPQATQDGAFRAEWDHVVSVERLHRECDVYDLDIEGTHCFFADGILVHNCGILDDPIKNWQEAQSRTVKEHGWNWFRSSFITRLAPGAPIIIIQTRWARDDIAGRAMEMWDNEGKPYVRLKFRAIAEDDDPILKRKRGEPLWPESGRDAKFYADKLAEMGPLIFDCLFQQEPGRGPISASLSA